MVEVQRGIQYGPQFSAEMILDYKQVPSDYVLSVVHRPAFTHYVIHIDSVDLTIFYFSKSFPFLDK